MVMMMMMKIMESSFGDVLLKVAMFVLVQVLVYLILSKSSNVFSKTTKRSHSFKPARSVSIRRILAVLGDMPPEPSPSPKDLSSPTLQDTCNSPVLDAKIKSS